jgi:hypothetical protein
MDTRIPPPPPDRPRPTEFAAVKLRVVLGSETVATARSVNMARRIANALNAYQTNSGGR